MNLDAVKAKMRLDKGMMQATDDALRAKMLLDKAALKELGENVAERLPELPWMRRSRRPRNVFEAVQFRVSDVSDRLYDVTDRQIVPTWTWLRQSWADRPWAPVSQRRMPRVGLGHLAALLVGAAFGALAMQIVNTRLNQGGTAMAEATSSTVDRAMRQTEQAIGSRWNRPAEAVSEREIPREEWDQFCENFTREHEGADLTVDRRGQTIVRGQPLIALSWENSDGRPDFRILTGERMGEHLAHVVTDVTRVQRLLRSSGEDAGLRLHNADGVTTVRLGE